jgi:hypothetical protein
MFCGGAVTGEQLMTRQREEDETMENAGVAQDARAIEADGWEWAIVEIFGHRKHPGRTREEERFGAKMLRIDVPKKGDPAAHGWETLYYGGSAIFSFGLTDEATVMRINRPYEPAARLAYRDPEEECEDAEFDG